MRKFAALLGAIAIVCTGLAQESHENERLVKKLKDAIDQHFAQMEQGIREIVRQSLKSKSTPRTEAVPSDSTGILKYITEDKMKEILEYIASDELEGRCGGTEGEKKATEYYAKIYKEAGLKPVGDKDDDGNPTYFQKVRLNSKFTGRNTIALLEGTDPELKNEYVVVGGHHDHLGKQSVSPLKLQMLGGKKGDDEIFNGADDNGSGSTTIATLAFAFGKAKFKPKRSIVFMTFTGEEWGLVGSAFYTKHPIFPLDKTVAMINLDMVGRNGDKPCAIQGYGADKAGILEQYIKESVEATGMKAKLQKTAEIMGGDSDHSSFIAAGVPAIFFFTGTHRDYHKVTDHVDKIDFGPMATIGKTTAEIMWRLACQEAKPEFDPKAKRRSIFPQGGDEAKPSRRLGITPEYNIEEEELTELEDLGLEKGCGIIKVTDVSPGTVAEKCGLKGGDIIIGIAGKTLPRSGTEALMGLRGILADVKPKTDVKIIVIRDGKKVTLTAQWEE